MISFRFWKINAAYCLLFVAFSALSFEQKGCFRSRDANARQPKPATASRSAAQLREKTLAQDWSKANRLTAKAQLYSESDGMNLTASANLIWVRDSALWISVKKFGIEAARVLITPDSAWVLNRLDKTCTVRSIAALQREYNLPPGGFDLIQQTVLGLPWFWPDMSLQSEVKDSLHRLSGQHQGYVADYRIEEGTFLLRSASFLQLKEARSVSIAFDQIEKTPKYGLFAYLRRVYANSPENGKIRLEITLSDVEINTPQMYRFEIPDYYQRR